MDLFKRISPLIAVSGLSVFSASLLLGWVLSFYSLKEDKNLLLWRNAKLAQKLEAAVFLACKKPTDEVSFSRVKNDKGVEKITLNCDPVSAAKKE